ncbi:hypothetical protein GGQ73_001231 [Rhizobium skierniewicense]|uniref:Uncharacterized protein n=1 Tax=Rhizobium skierniewicense TaxID=984260 RepID=A0A7W6C7B8_9HYPH|nr:hypothetical protein [Rhizobium skierniewicense]
MLRWAIGGNGWGTSTRTVALSASARARAPAQTRAGQATARRLGISSNIALAKNSLEEVCADHPFLGEPNRPGLRSPGRLLTEVGLKSHPSIGLSSGNAALSMMRPKKS